MEQDLILIDYGTAGGLIYSLVWLILVLVVIFGGVTLLRILFRRRKIYPGVFQKKIFALTVPKYLIDGEENQKTARDFLANLEGFYAGLGGLRAHRGLKTWLFGRFDTWSLEIVAGLDGLITFYLAVPAYLQDYISQQFLSHYPNCQIEEVDDYNIFGAQGTVVSGNLSLIKDKMFPLLTYKQMDADPLISVLSILSKIPEGQSAAIQFLMRSARKEWRKKGVKVASIMQQGKSLKEALASAGGGILGQPSKLIMTEKNLENKKEHRLSPMEEQVVKLIEEKAAKAGLDVNIRLVTFAPTEDAARNNLRQIADAFSRYSNYEYANGFKVTIRGVGRGLINDFIYRNFDEKINCVLNTEELISLWHLPLPKTEVPNIRWLASRKLAPPVNVPAEGIVLGENFYRGKRTLIRLKDKDRQRHMYVIGMTGTGKSVFQADLAIQDIRNGKGVCVVDPHGSLIDDYILPYIPEERLADVVYFNPADMERPIGLNMLEVKSAQEMDFAVQEMIAIFYKLLPDPSMAGPMFEHYMRNALLLLMSDMDNPGTLVELARVFTDEKFRKEKLRFVKDMLVRDFWEREYPASQRGSMGADMLSYVISKTGRFVENEMMRNIIGQSRSGINFRQIMDEGKILLVNLSKGKTGETNSNLLGLITVSKLQMAALARADMPEEQRRDFYLYIDEFQNFITDSVSTILAEARKYKLNLIIGHQYIAQLTQGNDAKIRDAVFGNVGNVICFRIGVDDSEVMTKQLAPNISDYDLMNIDKFNAYVRILVDNAATETFNMHSFPLPEDANFNMPNTIREHSRRQYGRPGEEVVEDIMKRSQIGQLGQEPTLTKQESIKKE